MALGLLSVSSRNAPDWYRYVVWTHLYLAVGLLTMLLSLHAWALWRAFGWLALLRSIPAFAVIIWVNAGTAPLLLWMAWAVTLLLLALHVRLLRKLSLQHEQQPSSALSPEPTSDIVNTNASDAGTLWRQNRQSLADFLVVLVVLCSGLNVRAPSPIFFPMHHLHGFGLLVLLLWFAFKRLRWQTTRQRLGALTYYAVVTSLFVGLYVHKQIWRGDDTDPTHPKVVTLPTDISGASTLQGRDLSTVGDAHFCRDCHPQVYWQWQGSTHRYAATNSFFRASVGLYVQEQGPAQVRQCVNCHEPALALRPDADQLYAQGQIGLEAGPKQANSHGVSCFGCHSIAAYDDKHAGNMTLRLPEPYPLFDQIRKGGEPRLLHGEFLELDPRMHKRYFSRPEIYRGGRFCAACHGSRDATDPDGAHLLHIGDVFAQWQASVWAEQLHCVDCHMPQLQMHEQGRNFFDHRLMAINVDLPDYGDVRHQDRKPMENLVEMTHRYLAGDLAPGSYRMTALPSERHPHLNPMERQEMHFMADPTADYDRFLRTRQFLMSGPILDVQLREATLLCDTDAADNAEETKLSLRIETTNVRVGHDFPGGLADVRQIWMEADLLTHNGATAATFGQPASAMAEVPPEAPRLGVLGMRDKEGELLRRHEFWRAMTADFVRMAPAMVPITDNVAIRLPAEVDPRAITAVTLRWQHRRFAPDLVAWIRSQGQPVADSTTLTLVDKTVPMTPKFAVSCARRHKSAN